MLAVLRHATPGYWVRDMNQKCYTGVHLYFWVPTNRFGFLYDRYRPKYYYWESILVLQVRACGKLAIGTRLPL